MSMNMFRDSFDALKYAAQFTKTWQDHNGKLYEFEGLEILCQIQDQVIQLVGEQQGHYVADEQGNIYAVAGDDAQMEMLFQAVQETPKAPEPEKKFCPYCGAPLKTSGKFCAQCGKRVK